MTGPIPVVIDCDPGVDDAIALLLAFASPELDLRAVLTVAGNVDLPLVTENACKVRELAGRAEVPVFAGCPGPLIGPRMKGKYSGAGGLGGTLLPAPARGAEAAHAVDRLIALAREAAGEGRGLTLCTLGPLTNVALALRHSPDIASGIARIVMMGGAFGVGGNRSPTSEFNVLADPHAAEIVFGAGVPIVMAPLDLTFQALATPRRVAALRAMGGRITATAAELITFYDRNDPARYGEPGGPLHDPTVIGWVLRPDLFNSRPAHVGVELAGTRSYGQTVGDFFALTGRPPNAEVLARLDAEGFFALLWQRLAAL
ncbi:MAG: nucleoside hydrolase [Alphaproteobacteria bacterium]|nr:nucleoside hydrolase [Alphaproteobacteria bacterium]